jgi:hypothetical protein
MIHIIKEISPDILGVCEMGSRERFEDFKKRLAAADLALPTRNTLRAPISIGISR